MKSILLKLMALMLVGVVSFAQAAAPAKANAQTTALHKLFAETWERDLRSSPTTASYFGDNRFNDRWPDISPTAIERERNEDGATLKKLGAIDKRFLNEADKQNAELFKRVMEERIAAALHKPWFYEMTMREGPQSLNEVADLMPFETVADHEKWLTRLSTLPAHLDQHMSMLRQGLKEGRTQPRGLMQRAVTIIEQQANVGVEESPFFAKFKKMPAGISATEQTRLANAAREAIGKGVIPAYQRFLVFFRDEYLPKCRETVGIWDTPDGLAYYNNRARFHTTTNLTAEEIHNIGLKEVARIHKEMREVMDRVGFKGTRQEFFTFLRTDPQFYFTDADDLFRAYVYTTKMIEPELPKLFGRLYRTPVGVKAIPMTSAPNTTTAYYNGPSIDGKRPGYFFANLYRPEARPKYEIEVLTAHEAIPGHHLQIALAQEQGELPNFRKFSYITAYSEGWALYSERLGFELGLYKNPYSHFGMLTYDMWRAVRLVVDTGIHVKKWSRQEAIDYFKDNAPKSETDIINEIDRYIGWPGQALAYKIGQLHILELRARAEKALGSKFDIRAFHDMLLAPGPLPLELLSKRVDGWIAKQR